MDPIDCPFRHKVRVKGDHEIATCRFVQHMTQLEDGQFCEVRRDACEICNGSVAYAATQANEVMPTLLYTVCQRIIDVGGTARCSLEQALQMQRRAEQVLVQGPPDRGSNKTYSCDVVVACADSSEHTRAAIRSVLEQDNVTVFVHLVDDGGGGRDVIQQFSARWNVIPHVSPVQQGPLVALHDLISKLRSQFVAIQDPQTISAPDRIALSLNTLDNHGAELFAASLQTANRTVRPNHPTTDYRRYLPPHTLAMRRSTFIDMGGVSDRTEDADAEFVYRAFREDRRIACANTVLAEHLGTWRPAPIGPRPTYKGQHGSLRHYARGFATTSIACDVVLPFHGHLDYVHESMQSLVEQVGAEAIIHLVDDATPEDTGDLLRYWGSHARVRVYRNERNLGQYSTFNNIYPHLETELVAVQDADDMSLPNRLQVAGNCLRLSAADIFGAAAVGMTDDPHGAVADRGRRRPWRHGDVRYSMYPTGAFDCFLINATTMMRRAHFGQLGGYADLGQLYPNRCGLDTDFQLRAYHAWARFFVSREKVVKVRIHADSATRNQLTGMGSAARSASRAECLRRYEIYRRGAFDPRDFGGLGNYQGLTHRL